MEILHSIVTGATVRPLPTTTEGWLIQISADVQATQLSVTTTNEKIDRLIAGAITLDTRVDALEGWRDRIADEVAQLPGLHAWRQGIDGQIRGIRFSVTLASGLIGLLCGIAGATVAALTGLAQALGGKHP